MKNELNCLEETVNFDEQKVDFEKFVDEEQAKCVPLSQKITDSFIEKDVIGWDLAYRASMRTEYFSTLKNPYRAYKASLKTIVTLVIALGLGEEKLNDFLESSDNRINKERKEHLFYLWVIRKFPEGLNIEDVNILVDKFGLPDSCKIGGKEYIIKCNK